MENEIFNQFCAMLDEVTTNEMAICVCMKCVKGSMMAAFVPSECSYLNGIYITSEDDDIVNINNVDSIEYDEMEDEYEIKSGDIRFSISRI